MRTTLLAPTPTRQVAAASFPGRCPPERPGPLSGPGRPAHNGAPGAPATGPRARRAARSAHKGERAGPEPARARCSCAHRGPGRAGPGRAGGAGWAWGWALTFSMVPGSRRSSSLQRTTPSFSDACKKTSGSEMVFLGDSSTPRVISHVTVCSAEFIAAAARAGRREGAPRAPFTSERRPGPRPPPPPPPPRPWGAGRRRLARPAQQVRLGSAPSRAPWPAVKCLFIRCTGTCGRPAPPPPPPPPPPPGRGRRRPMTSPPGEERRGARPPARARPAPRAAPRQPRAHGRSWARPALTCAAGPGRPAPFVYVASARLEL
jgi:hypothetical protein